MIVGRAWKRRKVFPGLLVLLLLSSARVSAQSVSDARQPFVTGLIQTLSGVAGTFGDERTSVAPALDGMERGLAGWDASIRAYATEFPARHFAVGVLQLDRGHATDAIAELTAAAAAEPARVDIRLMRALAYDGEGDAPAAAADFLAAWLGEPRDPTTAYLFLFHRPAGAEPARVEQAIARLMAFSREQPSDAGVAAPFPRLVLLEEPGGSEPAFLPAAYAAAARLLRGRRYEGAIAALRDGWKADPLNTDPAAASPSIASGAAAFREGRWAEAIASFQSAARDYPRSSEARRLLGTVYWLNDEPAKAIAELRAAIGINARDERSRMTLADVLAAEKQPAEAEAVLRDTIRALPDSGQAHWRLGRVLETLHRDGEALTEREAALALGPVAGERRAYAVVARAHLSASDLSKAEAAARARVAADPNDAAAHDQLGQIHQQQGRDADALVELTVASLLDPSRDSAFAAIAQLHLAAGRFPDAIDAARHALAKHPRNREARFALARALQQSGKEKDAEAELAEAERRQKEETESLRQEFVLNLVRIQAARLEQDQKWDEAAALRREVASSPMAVPPDFVRLGQALVKAGRHDEAVDILREALRRDEDPDTYRLLIGELTAAGRARDADATRAAYQRIRRERFLAR